MKRIIFRFFTVSATFLLDRFFRKSARSRLEHQLGVRIERAHDLAEADRDAEAKLLCEEILAANPGHPRLLHLSGVLALRAGDLRAARDWITRAIVVDPACHLYRFNLGNVLAASGETATAAAAFGEAVVLKPDHGPSLFNLGKVQLALARFDDAIASLARLRSLWPGDAATLVELGSACLHRARVTQRPSDYAQAIEVFAEALALPQIVQADKTNAQLFLGEAFYRCRRYSEALRQFHAVLAVDPDNLDALVMAGNCLTQLGRVSESIGHFKRVVALAPGNLPALSSILTLADYLPGLDAASNTRQRLQLAARFSTQERRTSWPNTPDPGRRLRIGYVSPDLRNHVAMYLFEAVLRLHDRFDFEWFVYDATPDRDEKSAMLRGLVPHWREINALPAAALAAMVEGDRIDILVDLAGHTLNNSLAAFAFKPAPVQVSWLAYPGSTGLVEIDYLISDMHTSPPHLEQHASETVWRLPSTRFSYEPPAGCAAPGLPEADSPLIFGCFNNISKLNGRVLSLWSEILRAVPGARLLLKTGALDDPEGRALLAAELDRAGIPAERVELRGMSSYLENFAGYGEVHIALDPFPFCGGLTSLDALWMGVPVVTLEQDLMAGRQTLAFLHIIGHPELIAANAEDYIRIAVELARDPAAMARYRSSLREAMRTSPLLDHAALTGNLEQAYRQMWRRWCEQRR